MSGDVLSQAEVESLLTAMDASQRATPAAPTKRVAGAPTSGKPREKVTPYDFRRPERVGKEQMRALQSLHEGFGRNFGAALSGLLRAIVDVKLTSVDQLTYSEFVFSLENPTCFNLIKADPLEGYLILDINPSVLYPIIDRLLGGGRETGNPSRRPLTEIELRLVSKIVGLFLFEMHHAWENVVVLDLSVARVESNPQLVQIVPPNEVVVLVSFEITLGDLRGMMNLCIPYNSIERIGNKLSTNNWTGYGKKQSSPESIASITKNLRGSLVEMVVELAQTRISTKELIGLRVGDIIATDKDVSTPLTVHVQGVPKLLAKPGAFKGRTAICIEQHIEPAKKQAAAG